MSVVYACATQKKTRKRVYSVRAKRLGHLRINSLFDRRSPNYCATRPRRSQTSSLRSGRYTRSFRVSTEVKQCSSEFGVPRGHESQTIILDFMQILESVLDPDSTVFSLGKGRKTCLRLAPRHRTETFQSLKPNTSHMRRVLFYLGARSETRSPSHQYFVRPTVSKLLCYATPTLESSSLRSGRYTRSFRVSTEVTLVTSSARTNKNCPHCVWANFYTRAR
jgi:hypothetical protein